MAVTITAAQLQTAIGSDLETATRLLSVCTELVNNYASSAPEAVANEAVIRTAGWLKEQPPGISQISVEGQEISYRGGTSPLRNSGAMALLSPFRKRRARAIG